MDVIRCRDKILSDVSFESSLGGVSLSDDASSVASILVNVKDRVETLRLIFEPLISGCFDIGAVVGLFISA